MSLSEILIILVVALLVFGPSKLPELAHNLGKLFAKGRHFKEKIEEQLHKQQLQFDLEQNIKKAKEADQKYTKDNK